MPPGKQHVHNEPLLRMFMTFRFSGLSDRCLFDKLTEVSFLSFVHYQDYPSIAHLVQKLSENNIQTIFAVTQEFQPVYKVGLHTVDDYLNRVPRKIILSFFYFAARKPFDF